MDCGTLCRRESKRCALCNGNLQVGDGNHAWKGGRYRKKDYIMCWTPDRGYVFEHILVMENILERPLTSGENVHHKNGIKDDNRPENLELWTRPQPTGIRVKDAVAWAQELLGLYAPELLNDCNSVSSDDGIRTRGQYPPTPPEQIMN